MRALTPAHAPSSPRQVLATAGASVAASILISASEIFQHIANYSRPALQKQIIRVLLMVPIYALCSFCSLAFPRAGPYLDVVRELYEALTIYAFTWFVLAYLEVRAVALDAWMQRTSADAARCRATQLDANLSFASFGELLASKPPLPHMWPLTKLLPPWQMGTPFIRAVQARVPTRQRCVHTCAGLTRTHNVAGWCPELRCRSADNGAHRLCAGALWAVQVRQRRPAQRAPHALPRACRVRAI